MIQNRTLTIEKIYALLDHFQDAIFVIESGMLVYANNKLQSLLEYPLDEILGQPFGRFIHEDDRSMVSNNYERRQQGEPLPSEYEFRIISQSGSVKDVRINIGIMTDKSGQISSIGTLHDLTEGKQTIKALAQSQSDIESILNNMPDVFYRTDMQGIITMMSPSCYKALGFEAGEMIGKPMASFYCNEDDRKKVLELLQNNDGAATQTETCLRHKDGSSRWVSTNAYIRYSDEGIATDIEGIARDITEQKKLEERLKNFAQIDDLTQVYNRRYFLKEANKLLEITKRYKRPIAALMIDLDSFKGINDTYGHHAGDEVLKHFTSCCKKLIRHTDIIGRLGGEEFAIITPETQLHEAKQLAERLRGAVNACDLEIDGHDINYTISIGLTYICSNQEAPSIEALLIQADKALYEAKKERNHIEVYTC